MGSICYFCLYLSCISTCNNVVNLIISRLWYVNLSTYNVFLLRFSLVVVIQNRDQKSQSVHTSHSFLTLITPFINTHRFWTSLSDIMQPSLSRNVSRGLPRLLLLPLSHWISFYTPITDLHGSFFRHYINRSGNEISGFYVFPRLGRNYLPKRAFFLLWFLNAFSFFNSLAFSK